MLVTYFINWLIYFTALGLVYLLLLRPIFGTILPYIFCNKRTDFIETWDEEMEDMLRTAMREKEEYINNQSKQEINSNPIYKGKRRIKI